MWIVVGGRLTDAVVNILQKQTGKRYQGVDNVLDLTNTILTKGLQYFSQVEGVVVLSMGCDSLVDLGWMMQLNRLGVPVLYFSNYDEVTGSDETESLKHIHVVEDKNLTLGTIAANIIKQSTTEKVELTNTEGVHTYA